MHMFKGIGWVVAHEYDHSREVSERRISVLIMEQGVVFVLAWSKGVCKGPRPINADNSIE